LSHAGEKKSFWNGYVESEKGAAGEKTVKLQPGAYDVRVIDNKIPQKPTIQFKDIKIIEGQTVEETADFTGGSLKVTTLMNGKPIDAEVSLFKPGGKKYYTHWTSNGVRLFSLPPGKYNVKVLDINEKGKFKDFPGIQIEGGKTQSIEVSF